MPSEQTIDQLNTQFAIENTVTFCPGQGNLTLMKITTAHAHAEIYLHGAHITHYQPIGQHPVIFLSKSSRFEPGKAIRGGVPICFPWFCDKIDDPDAPAHGVARTSTWTVESVTQSSNGEIIVTFLLTENDQSKQYLPDASFEARNIVTIGKNLVMTFKAVNLATEPLTYEIAQHTYFAVADARQIAIAGLENSPYIDTVEIPGNPSNCTQGTQPISITEETDRFYPDTAATCTIIDPPWQRRIIIEKSNSNTTIVWNPWIKKSAAMADFGDDDWPKMICVESANAENNAITLASNQSHEMTTTIKVEQN